MATGKQPAKTYVVRTDAVFHEGKSYAYGTEIKLAADEAKKLGAHVEEVKK
jgi:hypothetical protein